MAIELQVKTRGLLLVTFAALLLSSSTGSAFAGKLKFINFDVPGAARGTFAIAINDNNTVAGYSEDNNFHIQGFIRNSDATIVPFDAPGATQTYPLAINAAGEVAGYFYDASYVAHGYIREPDGTITVLDFPHADYTYIFGINNNGEIAGEFEDLDYHAFLKKGTGKFKEFGVPNAGNEGTLINGAGTIAGRYCTMSCWSDSSAFLRTSDGTLSTFSVSGQQITLPLGLNKSGLLVGVGLDSNFTREGFIRTPDGQITTDSQCGFDDLNNKGWIVGTSTLDSYYHGCIRTPDGTETFFDDPKAGTGNQQGTNPSAINNTLYVAGDYQDSNGNLHGFLVHLRK